MALFFASFWLFWDAFWPHFGTLGASWGTFWPHFGALGASWGGFLAQVGPSWPKIAKKIDFLNLTCGLGTKLGPKLGPKLAQDPPKSRPKPEKSDVEKQHIFDIDFGRVQASFWKGFWDVFLKKNLRKL